jgi:hypothetical protein
MYNKFTFLEQMEENINQNLIYPFHIKHDKLLGNDYYNENYPNTYHTHSFEEVLNKAYREPKAFYLTEDDKKYYSAQEINFIKEVIKYEIEKINKGMVMLNLELSEETFNYINQYKEENNLTFEEAINDILKKMIEENTK